MGQDYIGMFSWWFVIQPSLFKYRSRFIRGSGVQSNSIDSKFHFHWETLDKSDKLGLPYVYLIPLFNKSILLSVNVCKIAGWVTNSLDPDQMPQNAACDLRYTVCPGLSSEYNVEYVWQFDQIDPSEVIPDPTL